jgi:hypothetical protein
MPKDEALWHQIRVLANLGHSQRAIARELRIDPQRVKYVLDLDYRQKRIEHRKRQDAKARHQMMS